jgi:hypothetical protein
MEHRDIHGFGAWVHVVFPPDSRLLLTGDGSSLRAFDVPGSILRWTIPHMDAGDSPCGRRSRRRQGSSPLPLKCGSHGS